MGLIEKLPQILAAGKAEYEAFREEGASFRLDSVFGSEENLLAAGDNAAFMRYLLRERGLQGKVQMIYIDPPFFSKANYGTEIRLSSEKLGTLPPIRQFAYHDSWQEGIDAYLAMLCARFYLMRELLSDTGCLWVHLDWHVVHYVKVLLDEIFGEKNFINEIVWQYKSGGSSKKHYARKHDTLLFYAKSKNYYFRPQKEKSYNRGYKPYRFRGVREYRDDTGWYTMVNMKDVWQIDMVGRTSAERTGYVTQKPEALLLRILESCTQPGDLVCDFFGGSGTLAATAAKTGRRFISCDLGNLATMSAQKRLAQDGAGFAKLVETGSEADLGRCGIRAEVISEAAESSLLADGLVTVRLADYKMTRKTLIPTEEQNLAVLRRAAARDPLRFIEFWSVDYHYDGQTHRAEDVFVRDRKGALATEAVHTGSAARISVRAQDIFGNTAETVIE